MFRWICCCLLLEAPMASFAADATPPCLRYIEAHFFEVVALDQALNLYMVGQSSWNPIKSSLSQKSANLHRLAYSEGKKRRNNPFDYPFQANEAKKIVVDNLFTIFRKTLHEFDVVNEGSIKNMFSYILEAQQENIDRCLRERNRR